MDTTSISTSGQVCDLSPTEVLDGVRAAREAAHRAAVQEVLLAARWARLHPCPAGELPACWESSDGIFGEGIVPLAGPGTPAVAEFAPVTLAAAMGATLEVGRTLLADALELTYRLPRLWEHVLAGRVPVWRARQISRETHDLCPDAVAFADRLIAATPTRIGLVNAARLVADARLYFDPDRAVAEEEAALARRGVWLRHGAAPATTEVTMTLDTPDALLFDQSLTRVATDLRSLGDTDVLEVRRARAVGILADPQHALDLMSGRETAAPTAGHAGAANLYLHLTPEDLQPGAGAVTIERLGAATTALLTDWLTRFADRGGKITLRPVLSLATTASVDRHDPPQWMRESVLLRDAHCIFPGCRRDSRACDLDHIEPYLPLSEGGPPGQTHPGNLAPLCRTHHRVKTHTAWTYKRLDEGFYAWTDPTGHQYTTLPSTRRPVAHPVHRRT